MTKEEFEVLQFNLQQCGKSVKDYLHDAGVNYSTYNYWRKKLLVKEDPKPELAPISFTQHADPVFSIQKHHMRNSCNYCHTSGNLHIRNLS